MIVKTKGVCGGNARIVGTRIPVWGLEVMRRMGMTNAAIIERYPHVNVFELACAWKYVADFSEEIEMLIADTE